MVGFWSRLFGRKDERLAIHVGTPQSQETPGFPAAADLAPPTNDGEGYPTIQKSDLRQNLPPHGFVSGVGESFHRANFIHLCGEPTTEGVDLTVVAQLVPEPKNPYDPQAVLILVDGIPVAHLSREDARRYRGLIDTAIQADGIAACRARIRGGWDRGLDDRGHYGIVLRLGEAPPPPPPSVLDINGDIPVCGRRVSVSHEEQYQETLEVAANGWIGSNGNVWREIPVTVTLDIVPVNPHQPSGGESVRVCVAGRTVGFLTKAMTARYRDSVSVALVAGVQPRCAAKVIHGHKAGRELIEIVLDLPEVMVPSERIKKLAMPKPDTGNPDETNIHR